MKAACPNHWTTRESMTFFLILRFQQIGYVVPRYSFHDVHLGCSLISVNLTHTQISLNELIISYLIKLPCSLPSMYIWYCTLQNHSLKLFVSFLLSFPLAPVYFRVQQFRHWIQLSPEKDHLLLAISWVMIKFKEVEGYTNSFKKFRIPSLPFMGTKLFTFLNGKSRLVWLVYSLDGSSEKGGIKDINLILVQPPESFYWTDMVLNQDNDLLFDYIACWVPLQ